MIKLQAMTKQAGNNKGNGDGGSNMKKMNTKNIHWKFNL